MAASDTTKAVAEMARVEENRWIWAMKRDGATYDEIQQMAMADPVRDEHGRYTPAGGLGKVLGRTTIADRVRAERALLVAETRESVEAQRAEELDRLDAQAARVNVRIRRASRAGTWDQKAEEFLLKVTAERRRLLGLDTPVVQKVEATLTVDDARSVELAALLEAAAEVES